MKILFFSATGNTKFLLDNLVKQMDLEEQDTINIDENKEVELKGEEVVIMYPIHAMNAPSNVMRFLRKSKIESCNVSIIAVGCNESWINDASSISVKKLLLKNNNKIIVDEVIAMPLTLVMSFKKELKESTVKNALEKLKIISSEIKSANVSNKKVKLKSRFITGIAKIEGPAARLFGLELHANKKCVSCGLCWNSCPAFNIKENKKNKPSFGLKCTMCMRCIYSCPEEAIKPYISRFIPIKGGYKLVDEEK